MRVKEYKFGEFNEAQLKTSLSQYSIKFNDLAVQMRLHRIAYLRLLGRPYTLLYMKRSVGRLILYLELVVVLRVSVANVYLVERAVSINDYSSLHNYCFGRKQDSYSCPKAENGQFNSNFEIL